MFELKKATRENVKLRIGFWGPSGSGKTMSALKFAKGLVGDWSKIALLDTENSSGELYSHLGEYLHCDFKSPFSPNRYVEAIGYIANNSDIKCLIIDSISHEWSGVGGCLEMHEKLGGNFQAWSKITPLHEKFLNSILQSPFHVIVTGRTKIDYSIDRDQNNKTVIKKMGLKTVTREGLDYEMTLAFNIDINHLAVADKDRTDLFNDIMPFLITEEIGETVKEWNEKGITNFRKKFIEMATELCGRGKDQATQLKWNFIKEKIPYDKNNQDQNYWKKLVENLEAITPEEIEQAINS